MSVLKIKIRFSGAILVLVESPAKCAKIESYLGPGYKCVATFGHFRTLDGLTSIDTKKDFALRFTLMDEKQNRFSVFAQKCQHARGCDYCYRRRPRG